MRQWLDQGSIRIDPELSPLVALGVLVIEDVRVEARSADLDDEIRRECETIRERFGSSKSGELPQTADARRLYKALGIDPTKTRPSSEALLRRVLKGDELYHVNTLVDATNLVSLRSQLSFGLYDLAHISPPVVLRRGATGESYEGIRKGPVHVEDRPVLADQVGPFGNPTSDSARTMITISTRDTLVTVYAPRDLGAARVEGVLDATIACICRVCGGRATLRALIR
ncbi:MAG: hypothetical protein HYZ58_00200 [Acidobacteria bacterium]|nr:hypothetical protein [Acidobacteriota bacterium]MBI3261552.1 hypothetical protein [Acidobacteriota bacterium]